MPKKINIQVNLPADELKKKLNLKDGEPGKDYILTDKDKKEIAKSIKVPVVEKVIEKTEVITERPIIKEVAIKDTPAEVKQKLMKEGIYYGDIRDTPDLSYFEKNLQKIHDIASRTYDANEIVGLTQYIEDVAPMPDLSPYWKRNGSSIATGNWSLDTYALTANNLTSDYDLMAGYLDTTTIPQVTNATAVEVSGTYFNYGTFNYKIYGYKTVNSQKIFSGTPTNFTYTYPVPNISPGSVNGTQTTGAVNGYTANGNYSQITVFPYKEVGGIKYVTYSGPIYYGFTDNGDTLPYEIAWDWSDYGSDIDGFYITKYSSEFGMFDDYHIDVPYSTLSLLDTDPSIWTAGATPPSFYQTVDVQLDWDAIAGVDGYRIFLDTPYIASFTNYIDVATNTFLDQGLTPNYSGALPTDFSAYQAVHNMYGSVRANEIDFYGLPYIKGNGTQYVSFASSGVYIGFGTGQYLNSGNDFNYVAGYEAAKNIANNCFSNIVSGYQAMYTATENTYENIAQGKFAGYYLNNCAYNNLFGTRAGYKIVQGNNNTFIGYYSGPQVNDMSGNSNVGIGSASMYSLSSGSSNVGIAEQTLYSLTSGSYNFAGGYQSYRNLLTGNYNLGLGLLSGGGFNGQADDTISIGYYSNNTVTRNDGSGYSLVPNNGNLIGAIGSFSIAQRDKSFVLGGPINTAYALNTGLAHTSPMYRLSVGGDALIADNTTANLGAEKITNGTFTGNATGWTLGTGWAYSSNTVKKDSAGTGTLSQTSAGMVTPIVVGEIYVLEFSLSAVSVSGVRVSCAGVDIIPSTMAHLSTTTRHSFVFKAVSTADLVFTPNSTGSRFTIDNVSLKKVTKGDLMVAGNSFIQGGVTRGYVEKTANYTLTSSDYLVNCTANSFDITLPTAVGVKGQIFVIKNVGTGTITLKTTSSQTIDGNASSVLTLVQWDSITIMSDGANWIII